jgi:hypothetical protein
VAGDVYIIKNNAAAILKVYPVTGGTINAGVASAALSVAANTSLILVAYTSTAAYTIPLVPS